MIVQRTAAAGEYFHCFFKFPQTFRSVPVNWIETRRNYFLQKTLVEKERKITRLLFLDYGFSHLYITTTAGAGSVFLFTK